MRFCFLIFAEMFLGTLRPAAPAAAPVEKFEGRGAPLASADVTISVVLTPAPAAAVSASDSGFPATEAAPEATAEEPSQPQAAAGLSMDSAGLGATRGLADAKMELRSSPVDGKADALDRLFIGTQSRGIAAQDIDVRELRRSLSQAFRAHRFAEIGRKTPEASVGSHSLFQALFGRDSLRITTDLLVPAPKGAKTTILALARLQGVRDDPKSEEEPGRILHQNRDRGDPDAQLLLKQWGMPYYGSVDATPNWINLLADYVRQNGDDVLKEKITNRAGRVVTIRQSLEEAAAWIERRMDRCSGYVCVHRSNPLGIANQVWEDSGDSFYHEDGSLFDPDQPYAPVHVQGYAYDALLNAAQLLGTGPSKLSPDEMRRRAARLRAAVLKDFWQPDMGTFALAVTFTDGRAVPARVVASDPGHLLASRILDGDDLKPVRDQLARRLMQPDLLGEEGIRTRSTGSPRFHAGSYHNGSVWPMDTGVVIGGLRRHGYAEEAEETANRLLHAFAAMRGTSFPFPEFFRGEPGKISVNTRIVDVVVDGKKNRLEQPPQGRQTWSMSWLYKELLQRGWL